MTPWSQGDVIANGIRIHYHRTGGDKAPVVLCHGATDNGLCWTRLAKVLETDYDVIMPDARGHGRSEAPEIGYDAADQAADLAGLIAALKLDRPAIGGHSMGGNTAFFAAATYPGLVRCAILEDPAFRPNGPSMTPAEAEASLAKRRQDMLERRAKTREAIIVDGRAANPTWSDDEWEIWAESKQQVSPYFAGRMAGRIPWETLLPKVTCPMLLITADPERGGIVTPDIAAEAQRLLPALNVTRLRGAGHNVRREQFAAFVDVVKAFLAQTA